MNAVTGTVLLAWTPGGSDANRSLWALLNGEEGLTGREVVDIIADVLTHISSELGPIESTPGSHLESQWDSGVSGNIARGVLSMIRCWQTCDDPMPHLYDNVRIVATIDFMYETNLTERLLCCLFDLAGSLRDGVAKFALLDDEGVRVIR